MASRTILWASGVSVTTGVVAWRSSVVVAMAPVYGVPSTGRLLAPVLPVEGAGDPRARGRSTRRAASRRPTRASSPRAVRSNVPGRGHDTDRDPRMDQLRGRRGRANVDVRRHVLDEQLDVHLRQRVPRGAHRPRTRARAGLLQLRRPPRRQEGRPAGGEGGRDAHPRGVAEPRDQEEGGPREQERRDRDASGRRRLHLPQQARLRRRCRLRLPHRGDEPGRRPHDAQARGLLAAPAAPRGPGR